MIFPVDLALFEGTAHSPSFLDLRRSMGRPDLALRDYCIPVNPYFPTRSMFGAIRDGLEDALKYYPSSSERQSRMLARTLGLDPATVVLANGSTELITWIDRLLIRGGVATPVPTFGRWTDQPAETGNPVAAFTLAPEEGFRHDVDRFADFALRTGARAAVVCNPNNPTGVLVPRDEVVRLIDLLAHLDLVVIDESFLDFADADTSHSVADVASGRPRVIVLKSLGKNFGLHGVRFGYAVAHPGLAASLRKALPHWNVNGVAEVVIRLLADHLDEYERSRRLVIRDREELEAALRGVDGLRVTPSRANFVYARVPGAVDGVALRNRMLTQHGCLVRECGNKLGADSRDFRIAARPRDAIPPLLAALRESLAAPDVLGTSAPAQAQASAPRGRSPNPCLARP
jgi:histidinol-phosphate/aromatic aminotransferase/cobyric acid decarboxylase-like protein